MASKYDISSKTLIVSIKASTETTKARFGHLFNNQEFADIFFILKKDEKRQPIPANKTILSVGSDVFKTMFFGSLATKSEIIEITDVEPNGFMTLLNFLYFNEVKINYEIVFNTLYASNKYNVPSLENHCVEFLKKNLTNDNALFLLTQARLYEKSELTAMCLNKIDKNTTEVLDSNDFTDITLETLILILERDTLIIFESKLFESIVIWSKTECDRKQLCVTPENQRCVLGKALSLIRFSLMTIKEFEKGPIQSSLLDENEVKQFLMDNALNTNSTERPRCCTNPLEGYLKFYSETNPLSEVQKCYSLRFSNSRSHTVFVVGIIVLNIAKCKSNAKLRLAVYPYGVNLNNHASQSNNPSPDKITFIFNKPVEVFPYFDFAVFINFGELADLRPFWRPLKTGVIEKRGQRIKNMTDYFTWDTNYFNKKDPVNIISEILFYE